MKALFELNGVESHMRFSWHGKAVSINRRSIIGKYGKKRVITKSAEYRAFCDSLTTSFAAQREEFYAGAQIQGPVVMIVKFERGSHKGKFLDIDAVQKPLQDALESAGVILNDKQVLAPIYIPVEVNNETKYDDINVILLGLNESWTFDSAIKDHQS